MSEQPGLEASRGKRRRWWVVLVVPAAVIAVAIAVGANAQRDRGALEASGTTVSPTSGPADTVKEADTPSPSASEQADESPEAATKASKGSDKSPEPEVRLPVEKEPIKPLPEPVEVKINQSAKLTKTVSARIGSIERVQAIGRGPGEVSGAALRVTFDVTNKGAEPLDLSTTIVTLETKEGEPASPVASDPSAEPLLGALPPGESATGVYLFLAPKEQKSEIRIEFSTSTKKPVLVFRGRSGDVGGK